jgi:hypothetical protein
MNTSEEWRAECEAREWIQRYRNKVREEGKQEARAWWEVTFQKIAKKRGEPAAQALRAKMNEISKS